MRGDSRIDLQVGFNSRVGWRVELDLKAGQKVKVQLILTLVGWKKQMIVLSCVQSYFYSWLVVDSMKSYDQIAEPSSDTFRWRVKLKFKVGQQDESDGSQNDNLDFRVDSWAEAADIIEQSE